MKTKTTGTPTMSEEAREAYRAYRREWNRKNRDKVKAANIRYWERKAREAARNQDKEEAQPNDN